jgi:hypothetical protein
VFAKVDGDKFTAFLVERDTPGLSTGPEEKKRRARVPARVDSLSASWRLVSREPGG